MPSIYVSHPEVVIDPDVEVPCWGLSEVGAARARAFAAREILPAGVPIFASTERKATELAAILPEVTGRRLYGDWVAMEDFGGLQT